MITLNSYIYLTIESYMNEYATYKIRSKRIRTVAMVTEQSLTVAMVTGKAAWHRLTQKSVAPTH